MDEAGKIDVEVTYARPDVQVVIPIRVAPGTVVSDAIEQSGILAQFPEIDLGQNKIGIFGKLTKLDTALQPGDRVEIYRPLIADPKESRRAKAAQEKQAAKKKTAAVAPDGAEGAEAEPGDSGGAAPPDA